MRQKDLFSDAKGASLVRPDFINSNVSQLARLRQTSTCCPLKEKRPAEIALASRLPGGNPPVLT